MRFLKGLVEPLSVTARKRRAALSIVVGAGPVEAEGDGAPARDGAAAAAKNRTIAKVAAGEVLVEATLEPLSAGGGGDDVGGAGRRAAGAAPPTTRSRRSARAARTTRAAAGSGSSTQARTASSRACSGAARSSSRRGSRRTTRRTSPRCSTRACRWCVRTTRPATFIPVKVERFVLARRPAAFARARGGGDARARRGGARRPRR